MNSIRKNCLSPPSADICCCMPAAQWTTLRRVSSGEECEAWVVYLAFVHISLLLFWMSTVLRPSERKTKNVQKECEASPQFKLKSGSKSTSQNYDRSPKPLVCKREWCEPFCILELHKVVSQLMKITTYCRILQCIVWPTMWLSYIILACCTVDPPWRILMTLNDFDTIHGWWHGFRRQTCRGKAIRW